MEGRSTRQSTRTEGILFCPTRKGGLNEYSRTTEQLFIVRDVGRQRFHQTFRQATYATNVFNTRRGLQSPLFGFLACEVQCPAFDPRILLQAGDVEVNPGPACNFCTKEFTASMKPRKCGNSQCDKLCHLQKKCSGVSRSSVWFCPEHDGEPQQVGECDGCGRDLGRYANKARKCAEKNCPKLCHRGKKCSTISRYAQDGIWKCLAHGGRRPRQTQTNKQQKVAVPTSAANPRKYMGTYSNMCA